jgi:N-acetylmuramoyl-L-alanine amidase
VKTVASSSLAELKRTKAPAVLIETAYHDNLADAEWIQENIGVIGRNLAMSIAQFLGVPFVDIA